MGMIDRKPVSSAVLGKVDLFEEGSERSAANLFQRPVPTPLKEGLARALGGQVSMESFIVLRLLFGLAGSLIAAGLLDMRSSKAQRPRTEPLYTDP